MKYPEYEFQYIEFASADLAEAKRFYQEAFGWAFTDYGPEYTSFNGEHVNGGFYPGDPVHGSILPILFATDLEASLEKVKAAGGNIVREIFSFPGGRRFHFLDPDKNEIAVWSDK